MNNYLSFKTSDMMCGLNVYFLCLQPPSQYQPRQLPLQHK